MKVIKRIVCVFLSVMILFFGVSNSYFSPVKMDQVEAAGTVVLGYETMQAICYYFGSLVLGYSSVAEVPDLTEEQIEKVGHAYIKSLFTVNGVPDHVSDKLAMANQALFTLISNKQAYVFGSEALKEVAETEFQVITGGNNGEEEPSPSPDKDGKKPLNLGNVVDCLGALSVAGYSIFEDSLQYYLDKFNKNEENFIQDVYIDELLQYKYFDGYTIVDGLYTYTNPAYFKSEWVYSNYKKILNCKLPDFTSNYPYVFYFNVGVTEAGNFDTSIYGLSYSGIGVLDQDTTLKVINSGYHHWMNVLIPSGNVSFDSGVCDSDSIGWGLTSGKPNTYDFVYNATAPVFANKADALSAIQSGDLSTALNYLKEYRIADWLQEDWAGELVDPLTGLSYLNDLANLARHQGLNALGTDPSLDDMKQHLRDIIANLRPGYDPVTDPSVDPALDPICYPDTIPTPVIDPTADVVLQPAKDPTPSPNPDPSPSTSPKPTTQPTPSPGEIDSAQPVVDLSKFFPFCIPFDLIHLVQALDAEPVAPKWTLKLEPPQFPVEWEVMLDLSQFESLAKIFRTGETLLFVVGLILITRGIIKG